MVELAQRILASVWRFHFHIPPAAYWATTVAGIVAAVLQLPPSSLFWGFVTCLGGQGVLRWRWHRRRSVAMVVTRFSTVSGREGLALRVQELVMTSLLDKLPEELHPVVHPIPAVVGPGDRDLATGLLRRLECALLVHGRVEQRPDGEIAVFARSAQPASQTVLHYDWHTRDRTPARARWSHLFELLTPTQRVEITEYPLEFANELEAIARGFVGQVFFHAGAPETAEPFLRAALSVAPHSASHQVDQLRSLVARCLANRGLKEEGLQLLRARVIGNDPSPELLRTLALLLHPQGGPEDEAAAQEALAALRRAAESETDPARDMTLYNLAVNLEGRGPEEDREAEGLFEQLLRSSPFYRGTWYLRRHLGAIAYHRAVAAQAEGNETAALEHFKVAASFYSAAIRARPRIRLSEREGFRTSVIRTYEPSPILVANAVDAHRGAGHRVRAWLLERRFQRFWRRFIRTAEEALDRANWSRAYAYADWAAVGRHNSNEALARLLKAVAARQMNWNEIAEEEWTLARDLDPLTLVLRAELAGHPHLTRGVPGGEPTDERDVLLLLAEWGVIELEPANDT